MLKSQLSATISICIYVNCCRMFKSQLKPSFCYNNEKIQVMSITITTKRLTFKKNLMNLWWKKNYWNLKTQVIRKLRLNRWQCPFVTIHFILHCKERPFEFEKNWLEYTVTAFHVKITRILNNVGKWCSSTSFQFLFGLNWFFVCHIISSTTMQIYPQRKIQKCN